MKWLWENTTQVCFGVNSVKENLSHFVIPKSKIICLFGGGSIDKNGARADVQSALNSLECEVRWEGGILPNPEYVRLMEIVAVVKEFKPDLLLAVGGGSIIDGTKFIACAAQLEEGEGDPMEVVIIKKTFNKKALPIGTVLTIPATGSEWNNEFVVSQKSKEYKSNAAYPSTYPLFSLLDPTYTLTLPLRQLQNGVFDAFCHCTDTVLTPQLPSMFDNFVFSVMKELVEIGPDIIKNKMNNKNRNNLELNERLIVAASFALNEIFRLGETGCFAVHKIGHQLTAKYGIDHAASLAMVMPSLLKSQLDARKEKYAAAAEFVFNIREGTIEEKANKLIECIEKFIKDLGLPETVGKWPNVKIGENDIDDIIKQIIVQSLGKPTFGYGESINEVTTREILKQIIP